MAIPLALIGLVASTAGNIAAGIGSAFTNAERKKLLDKQASEAEAYYNKEIYQDPLKRADTAAYLRQLSNQMKEQTQQSKMTSAITGATPEAQIAVQEKMGKTYADTISKLAGQSESRKDYLKNLYRQEKMRQAGASLALESEKNQTWQNLASNATSLGGAAMYVGGNLNFPLSNTADFKLEDIIGQPKEIDAPSLPADLNSGITTADLLSK